MLKQLESIIREDTVSIPNSETGKYDTYFHKAKLTIVIFEDFKNGGGEQVVGMLEYPAIHEGFEKQIVRDNLEAIIKSIEEFAGEAPPGDPAPAPQFDDSELITVRQAADLLGHEYESNVLILLRERRLHGKQIGGKWLVYRSSVETFSKRNHDPRRFSRYPHNKRKPRLTKKYTSALELARKVIADFDENLWTNQADLYSRLGDEGYEWDVSQKRWYSILNGARGEDHE